MPKRLTRDEFIVKSNIANNFKYDYEKTIYKNNSTKVIITCPIHGDFLQTPSHHLNGTGCQKCSGKTKLTTEEFIEKANKVHNNKYNYSKTKYINKKTKVIIICPIHGEFEQTPDDHANKPAGCPKCKIDKIIETHTYSQKEFISICNKIHGDFYDYSLVNYVHNTHKIRIICPIHGEFEQIATTHAQGHGCPQCGIIKCADSMRHSFEKFLEDSIKIHGNKYTYNRDSYTSYNNKIEITCPEHGMFIQKAISHATSGHGCPKCTLKSQTKLFNKLKNNFNNEEILWEASPEWLGRQRFDIYFPKYNIAVEYNGKQHYEAINLFGGDDMFIIQQERDTLKRQKCKDNSCELIELMYNYKDDKFYEVVNIISTIIKKKNDEN